jgi:cyclic pyranopterin monophosphate synthase
MADVGLTHLDGRGHARMVDVTGKPPTRREATARCRIAGSMPTQSWAGADVLASARIIGIQLAKLTPDLVPLCHPLLIGNVWIEFELHADAIDVEARVECFGQTGVEMEALTACAGAALAICDLTKAIDPTVAIDGLHVAEKRGGRSGTWRFNAERQTSGT